MRFPKPRRDLALQLGGNLDHLREVLLGDDAGNVVDGFVALGAEGLESLDGLWACGDRVLQGVDGPQVVPRLAGSTITGCAQRRGGRSQGGIEGSGKAKV